MNIKGNFKLCAICRDSSFCITLILLQWRNFCVFLRLCITLVGFRYWANPHVNIITDSKVLFIRNLTRNPKMKRTPSETPSSPPSLELSNVLLILKFWEDLYRTSLTGCFWRQVFCKYSGNFLWKIFLC